VLTLADLELARFWKGQELDSKDKDGSGRGTWVNFDREFLLYVLMPLRVIMGKPFTFNSAYRTSGHNRAIGGSPASWHMQGKAVDLSTAGWSKAERRYLMEMARKLGVRGIGVSPTFIHLDVGGRDASWRYLRGKHVPLKKGEELEWA